MNAMGVNTAIREEVLPAVVGQGLLNLVLRGPLTSSTAPKLRALFRRCARLGDVRLLVDLEAVSTVDVVGVAALLDGLKTIEAQPGGMMVLRSSPAVSRALKQTGTVFAFRLWKDQASGREFESETTLLETLSERQPGGAASGVAATRGKRVYLRSLNRGDLEWLSQWADDPFLERMVRSEFLHHYKHIHEKHPSFYEACQNDLTQLVRVIMANHGCGKPVGLVRLSNIHLLEGYAFLEAIIADQKALRKGFGVEAGKLISYYGVDVLGLRRIEARVFEYNIPSINSLRRHGFRQEGILRQAGFQEGKYWDLIIFGILKDEIEEQRKKDKIFFPFEGTEGDVIEPA